MKSSVFLLLIMLSLGKNGHAQSDLAQERLSRFFGEIKTPIFFVSEFEFDISHWDNKIDSVTVEQHRLTEGFIDSAYPIRNFADLNISGIGRYDYGEITVILYKLYTTNMGSGNPIMVLRTLDRQYRKLDQKMVLWEGGYDYLYGKIVGCNIDLNEIITRSKVVESGFLNHQLITRRITQKTRKFLIEEDGKITRSPDTDEVLYENNDPAITLTPPE